MSDNTLQILALLEMAYQKKRELQDILDGASTLAMRNINIDNLDDEILHFNRRQRIDEAAMRVPEVLDRLRDSSSSDDDPPAAAAAAARSMTDILNSLMDDSDDEVFTPASTFMPRPPDTSNDEDIARRLGLGIRSNRERTDWYGNIPPSDVRRANSRQRRSKRKAHFDSLIGSRKRR